jgi:5S rRNA maturation endonuclease (ribonuclease M5)
LKYWVNEVVSLFDKKGKNIQEKLKTKLKDVIKKFIPSKYRTIVWPKVIRSIPIISLR